MLSEKNKSKTWKFDRSEFLPNFPFLSKDISLKSKQVGSLDTLLSFIEKDSRWQCLEQIAYFLATIAHECSYKKGNEHFVSMEPVKEKGSVNYFEKRYGKDSSVGKMLGNTFPFDGARYCGRGYVQVTGRRNYVMHGLVGRSVEETDLQNSSDLAILAFEQALKATGNKLSKSLPIYKETFAAFPDLMLIPVLSYEDAVSRMFAGSYTGKSLLDYITPSKTDYVNARRVINGDVKKNGDKIAAIAISLKELLESSLIPETVEILSPQVPAVPTIDLSDKISNSLQPVESAPTVIGHTPDIPATQLPGENNIEKLVGWLSTLTAGIGALSVGSPYLLITAGIVLAVLIGGSYLLYWERMRIAANPNLYNVK